jgi:hypothetical protein
MCKDILIGMALGFAVGMIIKTKNSDINQTVENAKSQVKKKLNQIIENF